MIKHLSTANPTYELEITYSEQVLISKLHHYKLNDQTLHAKLSANLHRLKQTELNEKAHSNIYLQQLSDALKKCHEHNNFSDLTGYINQLIYLWLSAIQEGASTQNVLNLLECIELKSHFLSAYFDAGISSKLHLFLFDLVAETSQKHQQSVVDYVVNYDNNTQLPNANQVIAHLTKAVNASDEHQQIALIAIRFQSTKNQLSLSTLASAHLNRLIATILKENIPSESLLYVAGSAQFDILIPKLTGSTQLNLLAAKLARAFEEMLLFNSQSFLITPFIGAAFELASKLNGLNLYENAQLALESAVEKQHSIVIFSEALKELEALKNATESKVLDAFANDNLTLFLQPIVNTKNATCIGAELLLRWVNASNHTVYPSLTIEILNKAGKGKLFTRWLINTACRYASELIQQHQLSIYLTINLRAEDLYDTELPHMLMQAISLWQLSAKDILLEITENDILEYNESSTLVIKQLAENGFRFALDDFGTGFSSLSRLRTMPIDLIKIDQSFVMEMARSKDDYEIVQSIALLAKSLGKEVLAEGVEDQACLALIKKLGIDKCQGYYFAKPMPFDKFVDWAKAH